MEKEYSKSNEKDEGMKKRKAPDASDSRSEETNKEKKQKREEKSSPHSPSEISKSHSSEKNSSEDGYNEKNKKRKNEYDHPTDFHEPEKNIKVPINHTMIEIKKIVDRNPMNQKNQDQEIIVIEKKMKTIKKIVKI